MSVDQSLFLREITSILNFHRNYQLTLRIGFNYWKFYIVRLLFCVSFQTLKCGEIITYHVDSFNESLW